MSSSIAPSPSSVGPVPTVPADCVRLMAIWNNREVSARGVALFCRKYFTAIAVRRCLPWDMYEDACTRRPPMLSEYFVSAWPSSRSTRGRRASMEAWSLHGSPFDWCFPEDLIKKNAIEIMSQAFIEATTIQEQTFYGNILSIISFVRDSGLWPELAMMLSVFLQNRSSFEIITHMPHIQNVIVIIRELIETQLKLNAITIRAELQRGGARCVYIEALMECCAALIASRIVSSSFMKGERVPQRLPEDVHTLRSLEDWERACLDLPPTIAVMDPGLLAEAILIHKRFSRIIFNYARLLQDVPGLNMLMQVYRGLLKTWCAQKLSGEETPVDPRSDPTQTFPLCWTDEAIKSAILFGRGAKAAQIVADTRSFREMMCPQDEAPAPAAAAAAAAAEEKVSPAARRTTRRKAAIAAADASDLAVLVRDIPAPPPPLPNPDTPAAGLWIPPGKPNPSEGAVAVVVDGPHAGSVVAVGAKVGEGRVATLPRRAGSPLPEGLVEECMELLKKIEKSDAVSVYARMLDYAKGKVEQYSSELTERARSRGRKEEEFSIGRRTLSEVARTTGVLGACFIESRSKGEESCLSTAQALASIIGTARAEISLRVTEGSAPPPEPRVVTPPSMVSPSASSREPFRLVLHPAAEADWNTLREGNLTTAKKLYAYAKEVATSLGSGETVDSNKSKLIRSVEGLWELRCDSYRFYYTTRDRMLVLLVLRAHHGRRQDEDIATAKARMDSFR